MASQGAGQLTEANRQDMSTSKSKIQLEWSSLHAESEGFVGVLNTRAEVKDQNDGKTGGVGVGHCNQEQTVRILRGLRFRGEREKVSVGIFSTTGCHFICSRRALG